MSQNICFRVTPEQKELLVRRASHNNKTLADYARDSVVNSDEKYMSGYWQGVKEERQGIVD